MIYPFEGPEVASYAHLSLGLRLRLDLVGRKLSLSTWQRLPLATRVALSAHPAADEAFREAVDHACRDLGDEVKPLAPIDPSRFDDPSSVAARAVALGLPFDEARWRRLGLEARFMLHHLAAPHREADTFTDALRTLVGDS